ncbi:hypothetical protein QVD17_16940 [Tagetes erecta]|uniref:DUF7866 domain-containing protein n=1 Tax=Tagetes erecta TaxID=13708 RepID=A0AAD8KXG4_TARER|nr:hypothetical protein QVD17_16940 [Tagetes erecta]
MEATKLITSILFLFLFISKSTSTTIQHVTPLPLPMDTPQYKLATQINSNGLRRKLGPFQVCLMCRCCVIVSDPSTCSNMPCCFGIDCQLPNKPFGVCAFVPKTCNCTSCAS